MHENHRYNNYYTFDIWYISRVQNGLVTILFELLSVVLGIFIGFKLLQLGIDFLLDYFPNTPKILSFLSFLIIFTLVLVAVQSIGLAIKKILEITIFAGVLDNIAGSIVGFLKYVFLISILVWLVKTSGLILPVYVTENAIVFQFMSKIAPQVVQIIETLLPFLKDIFILIKKQI